MPVGALCIRDFRTCIEQVNLRHSQQYDRSIYIRRDSNTPHRDASHTACEDDCAEIQVRRGRASRCEGFLRHFIAHEIGCASRPITREGCTRSTENAANATFSVEAAYNVEHPLVFLFTSALALDLK